MDLDAGLGFPYALYDFNSEGKSKLIEDPLSFMDSSCLHESKLDGEIFKQKVKDFFQLNKYNTHITCNFHNSFFDEAYFRGIDMKQIYLDLIDGKR